MNAVFLRTNRCKFTTSAATSSRKSDLHHDKQMRQSVWRRFAAKLRFVLRILKSSNSAPTIYFDWLKMKKIFIASVIAAMGSVSAMAADLSQMSIGAGYGFSNGGVVSVHGDYDISQLARNQPIKVRVGYDHYSNDYGSFKWSYNVFTGGAYYDFGKLVNLGNKIHPFAGVGFGFGSVSCSGCGNSPTAGGFYHIVGIQYDLAPNIAVEANINAWGGPSAGVNYKF